MGIPRASQHWSTAFRASDLAIAGEEAGDSGLDI
jgi:hypothetical protein